MRNQRAEDKGKAAMTTKFDKLMLDPEFKKLYAIEGLIADTAQLIWDLLERRNMKQADLARLLNKTPAFVSQLLNGKANMTLRTLAEVVYALGATVKINAQDESKSPCEAMDDSEMHTHRIHFSTEKGFVPAFKVGYSASECGSGPKLRWEGSGIVQSKSRASDTRSGLAA
jgi:transcriptional regulator with XRE-family HTH domain